MMTLDWEVFSVAMDQVQRFHQRRCRGNFKVAAPHVLPTSDHSTATIVGNLIVVIDYSCLPTHWWAAAIELPPHVTPASRERLRRLFGSPLRDLRDLYYCPAKRRLALYR